jgi:hypothetical protein
VVASSLGGNMLRPRKLMTNRCGALVFAAALVGCGGDDTPPLVPEIPREKYELPDPGALVAGVAEVKLPVPVGIGTMGYGAIGAEDSITPFADEFPGTVQQQAALTLKAVALSRGADYELVLVRADTIGIFAQLREAVLIEVEARTGRDLRDGLVLAGNHTHSGPGRLLMTDGQLTLLGDTFFPELYDRIVGAFADVIEQALADQAPAEIGHAIASTSAAHNDRRCENDPLPQLQEDPSMPVVVVRRDGVVDALVISYAYHGTILGLGDLTLSGDMGSAVEQRVEERFDHPVSVLFFNSWGGDMSPGHAAIDPAATGADQPGGYDRMESLGEIVADTVMPVVASVSFDGDAMVRAKSHHVRLDREVIGYDEYTFPYPHGGVFCGFGGMGECSVIKPNEKLDEICLKFGEDDLLPKQTLFTAGQIGELHFVSGTGEWSTNLAAGVLDRMREKTGGDAMFIGYANDYTGYSLNEEDWWQGGYETSGGLWGPKQGDYLAARLYEIFETFHDQYVTPPFEEPSPVAPFSGYSFTPYEPEPPSDLGTIVLDVPATVAPTDVVRFTVLGADPWLGTPVAILERDDGTGTFEPVTRPNGRVVDSNSYDLWVDLVVDPPYAAAPPPTTRSFAWSFNLPATRRVPTSMPAMVGPHRLTVVLPTENGDLTLSSAPFELQ